MQLNFKVERLIAATNHWYEVMLSPFESKNEVCDYVKKYKQFYPAEEQNYRVTALFPKK